ncbi:hypothetical protein F511_23521 [Dorcoceras hygrometricum]|uniref:Uncharacterized protein n=1 Tax=Dorcoceras hygrometricum TaxID=472368 RepID=A0A2Z7D729_9LAMI|nr:hypothetical protein F511_23521 [Dorcoceras hygrometricum]
MVVDLIGIYGLKGPYSTLTPTDWFLQALSVIPRGSLGDVARRFTMIRASRLPPLHTRRLAPPPPPPPQVAGIRSGRFDEENPFVQNSSALLVQPDEGVSVLVVDRIGDYLPQSTEKSRVLVIPVGARQKCQQDRKTKIENRPPGRRRARRRLPIARMSARDMRAGRAREANAGHNSTREDGLAVSKRLREWPVDAGGWVRVLVAPPCAYVAQIRRPFAAGCTPMLRRWKRWCDGWLLDACWRCRATVAGRSALVARSCRSLADQYATMRAIERLSCAARNFS